MPEGAARFVPSVKPVNADDQLLVITLAFDQDLIKYAHRFQFSVSSTITFCRNGSLNPGKELFYSHYVYDRSGIADGFRTEKQKPGTLVGYDLYVSVRPPHVSDFQYDLNRNPEDICIRLQGGNMERSFKSDILVVPKASIFRALQNH